LWAFETKKTAKAWAEFHEAVHHSKFTPHVICKHCRTDIQHPNCTSEKTPSAMARHLDHCRLYKAYVRKQAGYDESSPNHGMDLIDNLMGWNSACDCEVMSRDCLKERVLCIIISGNLPFSFAENGEFVDLLNDAFPDCPVPTRKTVVKYLHSKSTLTKVELRDILRKLDSKVSLALDV
jgi:hypothetical protein